MSYSFEEIAKVAEKLQLQQKQSNNPKSVLKSSELKQLYAQIPKLEQDQRKQFGVEVNMLKQELEAAAEESLDSENDEALAAIDITAPFDENVGPESIEFASAKHGSTHPLTSEHDRVIEIFRSMGFSAVESRQLDDDYHMFESLNFPADHPARDDYDTFMTEEGLIAPAHTSTMQNRVLIENKKMLDEGRNIQVVVPGRCFRNEDVDARHEHTLHQVEGVLVGEGINTGNLIATLKSFLEAFYEQKLEVKTQPAYFPFVEPGFEFSMSCPFCQKKGCSVCSHEGWIEILGCGLIHPNVLSKAGIDSNKYTGFAWGFGLDRLVMMQHNIDDIRWFHSGRLDFLEQFK